MALSILCDFDGTISKVDSADKVFKAFCPPIWLEIEARWERGEIGSAECMRQQMELLHASEEDIDAVLGRIEIDPTFPAFIEFCTRARVTFTIVSDGVDAFIRQILKPYRLDHLPVKANRLVKKAKGHYSLAHPHRSQACKSKAGTCKCAIEQEAGTGIKTVLIGDGRSDFCVSQEADIVFAKASLLQFTREKNIPAIAYTCFADIEHALSTLLSQSSAASEPVLA